MSESEQDHERAREYMRTWHEKLPVDYSEGGVVGEIRSALADPDHKSDTPQQFQRHFWPPADEPARDALAAIIRPYLEYEREDGRDIAAGIADKAIEAGWVNLFRFRHDITNTLGMALVHEPGDDDLGYDRGIVDAMDIVNALNQTESWFNEAAERIKQTNEDVAHRVYEGYGQGSYDSGGVVPATDVHACAKCGHAARHHPFPHCEWWVGDEDAAPEPTRLIGGDAAMPKDVRSPDEIQRSALNALGLTAREYPPKPVHAPFELQGGDLHGFRFCQACRKVWPCDDAKAASSAKQGRKGDPEAHIQHGGAL